MVICNRTFPPDFHGARGDHVLRCKRAIFRWVPLLRQIGMRGGQTVRWHGLEVLAARAAAVHVGSAYRGSLPLMVVGNGTLPPDFLTASRRNLSRRQRTISCWM